MGDNQAGMDYERGFPAVTCRICLRHFVSNHIFPMPFDKDAWYTCCGKHTICKAAFKWLSSSLPAQYRDFNKATEIWWDHYSMCGLDDLPPL